jgi:hypothetical protein
MARGDRDDRQPLPPLVEAAFEHLRETVAKQLDKDADTEASVVEVIAGAAADLQRKA